MDSGALMALYQRYYPLFSASLGRKMVVKVRLASGW